MKNLTIQHLAIAFANGQKVRFFDAEREKWHSCRITELRDGEMTIVSEDYEYDVYFSEVLLILRPLSDLTKEIEHNGEKFVPIERLFEIENPQHSANGRGYYYEVVPNWVSCSTNYTAVAFAVYLNSITKNQYWVIEQLISWHFDCFSLIENNLAIDINTIQK